ncbi:hypothetical protein Tco_0537377 [Tanacetum coccineum]
MNENPELFKESYVLYDRVINPLTAQQEQKTRKDRGTIRVPQVFQNPPNIDPDKEPFYTRQTEIINRQVQIRDEHHGGLRSIEKGLRNLWRNVKNDKDVTTTPSPTTNSSSLTPPNAPSKTLSTNQTSSSQENTSSSFQSKLQISPPSSNEPTSSQPLNPLLVNISDVPPKPSNP